MYLSNVWRFLNRTSDTSNATISPLDEVVSVDGRTRIRRGNFILLKLHRSYKLFQVVGLVKYNANSVFVLVPYMINPADRRVRTHYKVRKTTLSLCALFF